ncbi:MAG TPA: glycosyltransferase family 4 protein [Candidatus Cloacimonadota bacterium]|nr:glycosyltransferase family 4 protein [Candidatus Cloacimonadota bacterium]HPT71891.1 glycosyltransferase family 4 protein [Candidatus Cloacimonadota bacterium]
MEQKEIRVLHVDTERGWRGGQQQAGYLADHMNRMGYQTAIVCHPRSAFRNFARSHKIKHYSIDMNGEMDFIAGLHIGLLAFKNHYNILHLHSGHALAIGLWAKLFNRRLKLVATRRVDFHLHRSKFSRFKYDNRFLNKIICISDRIKEVLLEDRIPERKLVTIHSGVDIHKFDSVVPPANLKDQFSIPSNNLIIGTVAALVGHKDYPNLITAAKQVIEQRPDVTFIAVGDGNQKRILELMVKSMGLKNHFIFTGFRDDVGSFLKIFDIFVLASHLEGLGTSILDAQAVGLPVIATKTGGIPEAVQHEKNGLLVPPNSATDLANAIIRLCDDEGLRKQLGTRGRETVERFSIENTVEKNIKIYEELLHG